MSKKTLIIAVVAVLAFCVVLIGGKKAGWFGKSGNFKEVETLKITKKTLVYCFVPPKIG